MKFLKLGVLVLIVQSAVVLSLSAQEVPDQIYTKGKIITVDDYFSIQQAIAVAGDRIVAVGTTEAISELFLIS